MFVQDDQLCNACTNVRQQSLELGVGHREALGEVAQACAKLTVGAAVLTYDNLCQLGVGVFDVHRELKLLFITEHKSITAPFNIPRPRVTEPVSVL